MLCQWGIRLASPEWYENVECWAVFSIRCSRDEKNWTLTSVILDLHYLRIISRYYIPGMSFRQSQRSCLLAMMSYTFFCQDLFPWLTCPSSSGVGALILSFLLGAETIHSLIIEVGIISNVLSSDCPSLGILVCEIIAVCTWMHSLSHANCLS